MTRQHPPRLLYGLLLPALLLVGRCEGWLGLVPSPPGLARAGAAGRRPPAAKPRCLVAPGLRRAPGPARRPRVEDPATVKSLRMGAGAHDVLPDMMTYCGECVVYTDRWADEDEMLELLSAAGAGGEAEGGLEAGDSFLVAENKEGDLMGIGLLKGRGQWTAVAHNVAVLPHKLSSTPPEMREGDAAELLRVILCSLEALAREAGSQRLRVRAGEGGGGEGALLPTREALAGMRFEEEGGYWSKDLGGPAGEAGDRGASKGAAELIDVIDKQGRVLCVRERGLVERHNLLHRAIGVMVHNRDGQIYVHQRSPQKSVNPSKYDMLVGGLVLSGESSVDAALNEVGEELGLVAAHPEYMFTVPFLGSRNRCLVDMFRVEVGEGDAIKHNDGEVVWGEYKALAELDAMLAKEEFVPGGLACWKAVCERDLHRKYLR